MFLFAFIYHHLQVFYIDLQSTQSVLKCLKLKLWEECFVGRKCKHLKQTIYSSPSITNIIYKIKIKYPKRNYLEQLSFTTIEFLL